MEMTSPAEASRINMPLPISYKNKRMSNLHFKAMCCFKCWMVEMKADWMNEKEKENTSD